MSNTTPASKPVPQELIFQVLKNFESKVWTEVFIPALRPRLKREEGISVSINEASMLDTVASEREAARIPEKIFILKRV